MELIDKEGLLEIFNLTCQDATKKNDKRLVRAIIKAIDIVRDYPGIRNMREDGYWILMFKSTFPQYEPDEYKCSRCLMTTHTPLYHYCPACGTKMKGVIKNDPDQS